MSADRHFFTPPQTLYLANDLKTVVAEDDKRAAVLLANKGLEVPGKLADRFGLWDIKYPIEAGKEASRPHQEGSQTVSNEEIESRRTRIVKPEKR